MHFILRFAISKYCLSCIFFIGEVVKKSELLSVESICILQDIDVCDELLKNQCSFINMLTDDITGRSRDCTRVDGGL